MEGTVAAKQSSASRAWKFLPAMGHHGYFKLPEFPGTETEKKDKETLISQGWEQAQKDLVAIITEALEINEAHLPKKVNPTVTLLLSGFIILADRLASGTEWVEANQQRLNQNDISLKKTHPMDFPASAPSARTHQKPPRNLPRMGKPRRRTHSNSRHLLPQRASKQSTANTRRCMERHGTNR